MERVINLTNIDEDTYISTHDLVLYKNRIFNVDASFREHNEYNMSTLGEDNRIPLNSHHNDLLNSYLVTDWAGGTDIIESKLIKQITETYPEVFI